MNAQSMKVNPQELVIDLPLDEQNVLTKMESMSKPDGMIQPITIWLQDNRIIDGFHRTEAARRLGWDSVDVWVRDCDEEAFWDARIQSARQHHRIEGKRLLAWMVECWKQTKWYVPIQPDANGLMPRAYSNTSLDLRLVELVWSIFAKKMSLKYFPRPEELTEEEREVREWFQVKSRQWNTPLDTFADMFLSAAGIRDGFLGGIEMRGHYDAWARKYNLDLKQRLRLQSEITFSPGKYSAPSEHVAEAFIEEKIVPCIEDGEGYRDYAERKAQEALEEERQRAIRAHAERKEMMADPAYQRHLEQVAKKAATKRVKELLQETRAWVRDLESSLIEAPDGAELFAAFLTDMVEVYERLWPNQEMPAVPGAKDAIDTERMRRRVRELEKENERLKRSLLAAKRPSINQLALSGVEIEQVPV